MTQDLKQRVEELKESMERGCRPEIPIPNLFSIIQDSLYENKELTEQNAKLVALLKNMPQACRYAQDIANQEGRDMNSVFWGIEAVKAEATLKELNIE